MKFFTENWLQSRREFVKKVSLLVGASSLPWTVDSCSSDRYIPSVTTTIFDKIEYYTLSKVHNVLFPVDQFGPGAKDFRTVEYLDWAISDDNLDIEDKNYIIKGIGWIDEASMDKYNKPFIELTDKEIESLVDIVSKSDWGESWLSRNLTYIFEAQFSDELYRSNIGGKGWKWLSHYPGYPRPTVDMIYDNIFETISNKNYL